MKEIIFLMIVLIGASLWAPQTRGEDLAVKSFESKVSLPFKDFNKYSIFQGSENHEKSVVGARMFQLQLLTADCKATVVPEEWYDNKPEEYKFIINSRICQIQPKSGADCPSGFLAKNIPESEIGDHFYIGADKYKICIKDTHGGVGSTNSPKDR